MGKTSDLCEHGITDVKCEERERERDQNLVAVSTK